MALNRTIMIQGVASGVGKSLICTGLCRLYARRGLHVAPFKAQNMALNAGVDIYGGEMARSQIVQAYAAYVYPESIMNPILLKAESDSMCQVIVRGKVYGRFSAGEYKRVVKHELWPIVVDSLSKLKERVDLVVIEGAGSPVELNLKDDEIVNMKVAQLFSSPVILVSSIDKGGVFASVYGTLALLPDDEAMLVRGLLVNRFRGDISLFESGARLLEDLVKRPVLGVLPELDSIRTAEDALDLDELNDSADWMVDDKVRIAVVRLPRISNFDEFIPLIHDARFAVRFTQAPLALQEADVIILPGTKTTISDLNWIRERKLDRAIFNAVEREKTVIGICGGYQMLGREIVDCMGAELRDTAAGLGILDIETVFHTTKVTQHVNARVIANKGLFKSITDKELAGYEIHMGRPIARTDPVFDLGGRYDGTMNTKGNVLGFSIHGLFNNRLFRDALYAHITNDHAYFDEKDSFGKTDAADIVADVIESSVNMSMLDSIIFD